MSGGRTSGAADRRESPADVRTGANGGHEVVTGSGAESAESQRAWKGRVKTGSIGNAVQVVFHLSQRRRRSGGRNQPLPSRASGRQRCRKSWCETAAGDFGVSASSILWAPRPRRARIAGEAVEGRGGSLQAPDAAIGLKNVSWIVFGSSWVFDQFLTRAQTALYYIAASRCCGAHFRTFRLES